MAKITLSVAEAARELGISRPTMYQLIHREGFPVFRIGNRFIIPRDLLTEWVNEQGKTNERW